MGLQERRAIQTATESWLPKRSAEIEQICGKSIPFEIDWESFDGDLKGIEWLEHNGPHQVGMALRGLCRDDIGREAVQQGLSKVILHNVAEPAAKQVSLRDGILELSGAFAQSPSGRLDHKAIQACLEESL